MNYESLIIGVQWGIIGFFVLFHFLNGFRRGTKKSLYYTIVSFVLTFVLLLGVSFLTIRTIFTPGSLLLFIERFTTIPEDIRIYLVEPELSAVLFAVIDVVLRIVAFIVLYPVVKWLFTILLFRPIYKHLLDREHKHQTVQINRNKGKAEFVIKPKKRQINVFSRVGGALLGGLRGLVVAFVFLLPIIMLGSISRGLEGDNSSEENINKLETILLNGSSNEDNDFLEILRAIQSVEEFGLGQFTKGVNIGDKTVDEAFFDFVFTTKIVTSETNDKLIISEEIKNFGNIATILIENGYLESDFKIEDINYEDNYEDIDFILNNVGKSKLVNSLFVAGVDVASKHLLPSVLGFDPNALEDELGNKLHTKEVIKALKLINLNKETESLSKAIEQALLLGSVGDLLAIAEDPNLFLELSVEEQRQVSLILTELSNLELLVGINLAVEALIRNEDILENFAWVDNPVEYLQEKLSFILEDNRLFIGNDGEIAAIANFVAAMFADEFADFDYTQFTGDLTPEFFLNEEVSPVISAALVNIVEINTVLQLLPLGVDYFVYGTKPELIEQVSDEIVAVFNDVNYKNEFLNIDSIYKLIVQLGLEAYFEEDADVIAVTDSILSNEESIGAVRQIVQHLFEGSEVVNEVLTIVAKPLVESMVEDDDIKQLALKVVESDILYGKELNNILNLLESVYKFSSITEVMDLLDVGDMNAYLNLAADFGGLNQADFDQFKINLTTLQTFDIIGIDLLQLVKDKASIEQIVIPLNASLNYDLNRVLDLVYEIAKPLNVQRANGVDALDINLSNALDHNKLAEILKFTAADENSILLASAVEFIKSFELNLGELGEFEIPTSLINSTYNEEVWLDELNNITTGLFRTISMLDHDEFILSYNNLTQNVKGLSDIPAVLIARFGIFDELTNETIGVVLESKILRANATTIGQNLLNDTLAEQTFSINLPQLAIGSDGYLLGSELTNLVFIAAQSMIFLEQDIANVNMQQFVDNLSLETGIAAFNNMNSNLISRIGNSKIINGIFREALLNADLHEIVYNQLNGLALDSKLSPLNNITSGVFDFDVSLENNEIPLNTLHELLEGLKGLQIPVSLISDPSNENLMNFLEDLNTENVISIVEIKVIHELLDNVIKLSEVEEVGRNFFDDLLLQLNEQGNTLNLNYNDYYSTIYLANDSEGLFAISEVRNLVNVFKALQQVIDFDNLNEINVIETIKDLETAYVDFNNGYEVVTKPILLRALIGTALNDHEVLNFASNLINDNLANANINVNFTADNLQLPATFFERNVVLDHKYLYDLVLAVASLDTTLIDRNFKIQVSDITNLLNSGLTITEKSRLELLYNSDIIEYILKEAINNDDTSVLVTDLVNEQISNLANQFNISPTYIAQEDLSLTFDLINLEAMTKTIVALDELNINDFSELTNIKSIKDLGLLLDLRNSDQLTRNIFEIPLLLHALEVVLTSDTLGDMAKQLVDDRVLNNLPFNLTAYPSADTYKFDTNLVTTDNFVDLVLAIYGANIDVDDFNNSTLMIIESLLSFKMANRVEDQGIRHLYNSDIINHFISLIGENEEVHQVAADAINHYLSNFEGTLNVNLPKITTNDLALNNSLFDVEALVKMLTFVRNLELDDIKELTEVKSVKDFGELLNLNNDDVLLNELVNIPALYHVYERLLLSDFGTELVQVLVNEKVLPLLGDNLTPIDKDQFKLDETVVNNASFKNLFIAVYGSNLDVDTNFNDVLAIASKLGAAVTVANGSSRAIEFIFGFDVIPHVIKNVVESPTIQDELVKILNEQLSKVNLNAIEPITKEELNITYELFDVNAVVLMLDAFNALNINDLNDLTGAKTVADFGSILKLNLDNETLTKVLNIPLLDHALNVVLTNDMLSEVIKELVDNKVLPLLPFEVNAPGVEAYKINEENLTTKNYVDLVVSLYGTGLEITDRNVLDIIDKLLENHNSAGVSKKGIEHLYNNNIVEQLLSRIENEELSTMLTDIVNGYIDELAVKLEVTPVHITSDELNINKTLLDSNALVAMLTAVQALNLNHINDLTSVKTINQAFDILDVEQTDENVLNIMNIPLISHIFNILFTTDVVSIMGHEYVNRVLPENITINLVDFKIDPQLLTPQDFTDLIIGAYGSGVINSKNLNTPALFTDLTTEYRANGVDLLGIEHIMNAKIIHNTLDQVLKSDGLRTSLIAELNKILQNAKINANIEVPEATTLPAVALDGEGKIAKEEFVLVVKAVAALNLDSYSQLTSIKGVSDVLGLISRDTLDTLLESELVYYYVGLIPFGITARTELAKIINEQLKLANLVTESDLSLNDYGNIFNRFGEHQGYLTKEEIGLILDAIQATKIEELLFSGNIFNIINRAVDVLLQDDTIDLYFESNLLTASFDKLINVKNKNLEQVYVELIDRTAFKALNIRVTNSDNLFDLHTDALTNNGVVNPFEIKHLLEAIQLLNIRQGSNLNILLNLVDRNVDVNNEDDFDKAFKSVILRSLITNLLQSESFDDLLLRELNKSQDRLEITKEDIELPNAIFVDGLIANEEIKALLRTARALDIGDFAFSKVGLPSLLGLVGGNVEGGRDDFDRMLDSILMHNIIDRIFKSEELGNLVGEVVSKMFDKDIANINMTPANKLLDANGMFAKGEIKAIIVSIKLLNVNTFAELEALNVADLMNLINSNEEAGVDDLNRFLASGYIATTMSKLLSSNTIREQIALGGKFAADDLDLLAAKDSEGFMTEDELYNLFIALNMLGVNDINNMDISNETLKALTDAKLDVVLTSAYMYQVIDLTLKAQLDSIPEEALVANTADKFFAYILKEEIKALIETLSILDITDAGTINPDIITIKMLEELVGLNSKIVNRLLSTELLKLDNIEIPESSLENAGMDILSNELTNIVATLLVIANNDETTLINNIDTEVLTQTQYQALLALEPTSPFVSRLISKAIIEAFNNLPEASYQVASTELITRNEMENLDDVLTILAITAIDNNGFKLDSITVAQLSDINDLDSPLFNRLISESIILEIPEATVNATEANGLDLKKVEIDGLILAMNKTGVNDLDKIAEELTLAKLRTLDPADQVAMFEDIETTIIYYVTSDLLIEEFAASDSNYDVTTDPKVELVGSKYVVRRNIIVTVLNTI